MAKGIRTATNEVVEQPTKKPQRTTSKLHYEEWKVEISKGKFEKLKMQRDRVLLTEEQADLLNAGVIDGGLNKYGVMYFLKETTED
jgi:hypothetical protein